MSTASRPFDKLPGPVKRLIYASLAITLFFGASAFMHPETSMAQIEERAAMARSRATLAAEADKLIGHNSPAAASRTFTAPSSARPLIGTLTGSPYFIWVYAGPAGPLYTVADRQGRTLAVELDAESLYERLPDVSVQTLQLERGATGPLMMVDPASQR